MRLYGYIIPVIILLSSSCTKSDSCNATMKKNHEVIFTGNMNQVKSPALDAGVRSLVIIYNKGEDPCKEIPLHNTPVITVSQRNGTMKPSNVGNITVNPGEYDFYAVSAADTSTILPHFTFGISDTIHNNKDYLWAGTKGISVYSGTNIVFLFRHIAVNLTIEITQGEQSFKADSSYLTIMLPREQSVISLPKGMVTKSNSTGEIACTKEIHANKAEFIVIPLNKGIDIPIELINYKTEGSVIQEKSLKGTIPAPSGGFEGGYRYRYTVNTHENMLMIQGCTINEWMHKEQINISIQ